MRGALPLTAPRPHERPAPPSPSSSAPALDGRDVLTPLAPAEDLLRRPQARSLRRDKRARVPRPDAPGPEPPRGASSSLAPVAGGAGSMPLKERFARRGSTRDLGTHAAAHASSSTVSSADARRLLERDSVSTAIDIERAIALLQELKKTASPEDLVALHRALLPTKDVETVASSPLTATDERAAASSSPVYRRRSAIPPGLATRGGLVEDLLRKPGDRLAMPPPTTPDAAPSARPDAWRPHGGLAALDLADDGVARAVTPCESDYAHMGAFRLGTLRVTNGAASPAPSTKADVVRDLGRVEEVRPPHATVMPSDSRSSMEVHTGVMSASIGLNGAHDDAPLSVRERATKAGAMAGPQQARELPPPPPPLHISLPPQEARIQQMHAPTVPSPQSLERDRTISPPSASPLSRFARSGSQSASQFSAEYTAECDIWTSPYEEKKDMFQLASRLSAVSDGDSDGDGDGAGADSARGARHAALSRLSSNSGELGHMRPPTKAKTWSTGPSKEQMHHPPRPQEVDGVWTGTVERGESAEDAGSLYTFEEVLKAPDLLSGMMGSRPSASALPDRTSPLIHMHTAQDEPAANASPAPATRADASTDTISTVTSSPSSPADSKKGNHLVKQKKKLQKPMPEAVKKQRKEEERRRNEAQQAAEWPAVPEELSAALSQRLRESSSYPRLQRVHGPTRTLDSPADHEQAMPIEPGPDAESPSSARGARELKRRSFSLHRGKSHGRRSSNGVQPSAGADDEPENKSSWSFSKTRRRSQSRGRSQSAKRSSVIDAGMSSGVYAERDGEVPHHDNDDVPAYTDFTSVARALGAGSYDISTNLSKRNTAPVPSAVQHHLQSPHTISTGLSKSKLMQGMTPDMASELARMRSRDVGDPDIQLQDDRSQTATPKGSKIRSKSTKRRSLEPSTPVEDRFPDRQTKSTSSTPPQQPRLARRPYSMYAESIPPMPDMPADVVAKAHKAEQMVAKKLPSHSARATPASSARDSAEVAQQLKLDSAEKAALDPRRPSEAVFKEAESVNVAGRGVTAARPKRGSANGGGDESAVWQDPAQSPVESDGWEQQAKLWRQRRQSLGAALAKPADTGKLAKPDLSSNSPSIVVSRYITPLGADDFARANDGRRPTDAAAQRADVYRDLVVDDKENRPAKQDVPRTDSAISGTSTSTFVTVKSWDPRATTKQEISRPGSVLSTTSHRTAATASSAPLYTKGHATMPHFRTSSGRFLPYSPSQAGLAEQSRSESLAKLTGSSANASATSLGWMDGSANTSTTSLGTPCGPRQPKSSSSSLYDRYSGGLDYGWERGIGFNGSAGTRHSGSEAKRKSVQASEQYGLDLSDVPVFLQKAG